MRRWTRNWIYRRLRSSPRAAPRALPNANPRPRDPRNAVARTVPGLRGRLRAAPQATRPSRRRAPSRPAMTIWIGRNSDGQLAQLHRRAQAQEPIMARILTVDDSPVMRQMVKATLAEAGHVVTQAANGEEALRIAATQV